MLADDLIWASRLVAAVRRAGAEPVACSTEATFAAAVASGGGTAIVDLAGRSYDGIAQVGRAAAAGHVVLAVAQHDDLDLRRRALAAGARRVLSYNKLFTAGQQVVAALLDGDL